MEVSQNALAWMLLCSFLCGLVLGFCYDVLRLTRMWIGAELSPTAILLRHRLALPPRMKLISVKPRAEKSDKYTKTLRFVVLFIEDILFCLLVAITLALLLYQTNDGQFRLSAVAMLFCGIGIYLMTIGRLIHLFSGVIFEVIRAMIIWLLAILAYPMVLLGRYVAKWTAPLRHRLWAHWQNSWQSFKKRLDTRKQARIARRIHKQAPESSVPRPLNGKHYFSSGKQKDG